MVLINPQVILDLSEQPEGRVEISFPEETRCQAFAIPLKPSQETLERWSRFVVRLFNRSLLLTEATQDSRHRVVGKR